MNWFIKFSQYLDIDFNLITLEKLLSIQGEHPGQDYLFQNEELNQQRNLRGNLSLQSKQKIQRIIELTYKLFDEINNIRFEYHESRNGASIYPELKVPSYDNEEVIEEAKEIAYQYIEFDGHKWKKGEFAEFMAFLSNKSKLKDLLDYFFDASIARNPNVFENDSLYQSVKELYQKFNQATINIEPSFQNFEHAYQIKDPNTYYKELINVLVDLTEDMIVSIVDNNQINPFSPNKNKNLPDNPFLPWINKQTLKELTDSYFKDELADFYLDRNENQLLDEAIDAVHERDQNHAADLLHGYAHKYGDMHFIAEKEPISDDEDPRKNISIITLSEYIQEIYDDFKGMTDTHFQNQYQIINCILLAIKKIAIDPNIQNIFNNRTVDISANTENYESFITSLKSIQQIEEIPQEILNANIEDIKKEIQEQEEFANQMLQPSVEEFTDTQKLKELGIKNPFPHSYSVTKSKFPGSNAIGMPANMVQFTISIAPANSDIPNLQKLLQELALHYTDSPNNQNPLGWVGGFADYTTRTMYITEIQSDIMQRTKYMINPELQKNKINENIHKTQQELDRLNKLEMSKPPKLIIQEQINRITNEQSHLPPNSTQYNKNIQLLNRLQQHLDQAPEVPNKKTLQIKIRKLTEMLSDLNFQLSKVDTDTKLYKDRGKDPTKYHSQKGIIEKTFRDWIPIFFNATVREAKKRNFKYLKLISANQLMKAWSTFGGNEKENLFKKIYDNTAQLHNGKPITEQGSEWWDIPLETVRYANNWYTKTSIYQ